MLEQWTAEQFRRGYEFEKRLQQARRLKAEAVEVPLLSLESLAQVLGWYQQKTIEWLLPGSQLWLDF